ncbi:polar amino acid transport system permease protein [Halarchaeum rubridurum]|uniref:Polar amino acid transport system permease protein n=1 Tax=Halarchaeum rubridurum TaxID=489911 RepID=A0A830FX03_9EURY|nr:amino acid ABC transporter permease [Halarchaeum rubridurum]MBP1953952.1 polar amino acid transport system permease protein [Halarchaeum rubridurum]GGM56143.1 hypothetical protein GCM10009017_02910 [Halarchaeum rubridurum]
MSAGEADGDADADAGGGVAPDARTAGPRRSRAGTLKYVAGAVLWGWVLLRWGNDWLGGVFVPRGQAFVPPATVAGLGDAIPVLAGVANGLAFAVHYLPNLMNAMWLTVVLTVVSITLGFPLAVALAAARSYGHYTGWAALGFVELFRGTPLLAQLFVLYYGLPWLPAFFRNLPFVGEGIVPAQAVWVAVVGFTLNSAAYQGEYIRGAIDSVDPGQLEAGRAVGLSKLGSVRYVVLPQALRYAIPGWTNELVYLIKYSSLAAFITVPELLYRAQAFASETYRYTELFVLAGVLYLGLVVTASSLMGYVEGRVAIPGLGNAEGR